MKPISREALATSLAEAQQHTNLQTSGLSEHTFLAQQSEAAPWAITGFSQIPDLTFAPRADHIDAWSIGWQMTSAINATLIAKDDELHAFYRATPRKESLSSRIGHSVLTDAGWRDSAELAVWPTQDDEVLGVEDPKIYRFGSQYHLYYNGIFRPDAADLARFSSAGYPINDVACDINLATSEDLMTWTKRGTVVPHDVSHLWAKGAVIPRSADGDAVRINGEYLMYLSKGCGGKTHVGRSDDGVTWRFAPQEFLDLSAWGAELYEVATCFVTGDHLVLDIFCSVDGEWRAGQALYASSSPFEQLALSPGGTLAWGGLTNWHGNLSFMQGWDAPTDHAELQFFARS